MEDEESSAHDDNTIQTTCNICGQTFKNKVEVNAHVKSAHFGMKDLNKDSQVVVNLDDEPDEDMLSDSYDEMIVDNDSVCSLCYCIFKDNIDLKSHIRLAHQDKLAESLPSKCNNNVLESAEIYIDTNDTCYKADAVPSESVVKKLDKATREHDYTNDSENNSYCHISNDVFDDKGGDGSVSRCEEKLGKTDNNGNKNLQSNLSDTVIIEDDDDARKDNSDNATNKMYERVICNICVKEFEDRNSLTGHIRSDHFGITSYKCAMCSLSFENRNQVIKHYNNCTGNSEQIKNSEDSENSTCNSNVSVASANRVKGKAKNAKIVSKKYLENIIASAKKEKKKPAGEQSRRSSTRIAEINSRKAENSKRSRLPHIKKNTAKKIYKKSILRKARKFGRLQVVDSKESIRPCFICGDKYFSTSEGNDHLIKEHSNYKKLTASELQMFRRKPNEKFKCLRCGKVGLLHVVQQHIQEKCVRAPFQGITFPKNYFCSVCGEHFLDAKSHDYHVASLHYPHLFKPDFKHFASMPFPHVLLYHISPDVCQHCGQICQNTVKLNKPTVKCIKGPYVCPYPHSKKLSMRTLDLLLHHVKFCRYKAGVLALQCNNCFKMLLCNNSPQQIDQLREVIKMPKLGCCPYDQKSFKCYCCTQDYTWSVVTKQLKASIDRIDYARSHVANYGKQLFETLQSNPSIHTKCPQFQRFASLNNAVSNGDQANSEKYGIFHIDHDFEIKRRATSFDMVHRNLAYLKQYNSCKFSSYCNDEMPAFKSGDNQKSVENRDLEKAVVSQPVDAIRIENTFKRSLDPVSTQLKLKQSLTHTVDNNGPSLKKPFQNDNFGKVEVIPALEGNSCSIKQVKTERLINPADKKLKQIKSSEESSVEPSDTNSKRYGSQESGLRFLSNLTTCNICSSVSPSAKRVFFDSKSIVRHMAEHKGQQPKFICYDCNTEFNSQGVWKRHITVAHPLCMILECDYKDCTMEFQRPQDLQKHIFSEHCHMFGCAECLAPFNSEQELISHSEAMHGKT